MNIIFRHDSGTYDIVRPGRITVELHVPEHILKPSYYYQYEPPSISEGNIEIKRPGQVEKLRESCRIAANILKNCSNIVQVRVNGRCVATNN